MRRGAPPRLVLLGIMTRHPVAGVVWQTLHYLEGFRRLGWDVWYVEAGGHQPSSLLSDGDPKEGDRCEAAARFLDEVLRRFDLADRWALHALHSDGRCWGLGEARLKELYDSADLIINLHGATLPRPEHVATERLVYLETDPVWIQIELHRGLAETEAFLAPHAAFFTFGENYGKETCGLPVDPRFHFHPTRQPVVLDLWDAGQRPPGPAFTTIGNWKQTWRDVEYGGEVYRWSKHHEFLKVLELPRRSGEFLELALSPRGCSEKDRRGLETAGWRVRDGLELSTDLDAYRCYIQGSRGEFTVAKDQNVRFRTGWFSDRSATYLAAGRPVVTQDTGFGEVLPTGEGLLPFATLEDAEAALADIRGDWARHARAAREIAREFFGHDVVLPRLLSDVGL